MSGVETRPLILYVDDERTNRIVLEQSLKVDFNIIVAESGERALEILAAHEVAVLITDMRMPGMEGDVLLRLVKERHPQVVRMVMTAYQDVGPILRSINEGLVARYIIKPWDRAELGQALRWGCEAWAFGRESAALHQRLMETERLATLGSIAGLLVHDLRQPLVSQAMNIALLEELAQDSTVLAQAIPGSTLPVERHERVRYLVNDLPQMVGDLRQATHHLNDMVGGLRELGKPRSKATPGPVDPMMIIKHAIAVCQEAALKARATIRFAGPSELPAVLINHTELMQILINVIANASQAIAARGEPNGAVDVTVQVGDGEMLVVTIADNGIGMEPAVLAKVGTPFFTTRAEGTGLGLAQCHRLVGDIGGRFKIESDLGQGTTVTITLPTAT